ncbi:DUF4175 family protein [Pedobacter sp. P351]|uniref:DUF4175 family protein n=1 Tax=Pedobacter superstes TaxID=3133441 RepID=UPI0030A669E8
MLSTNNYSYLIQKIDEFIRKYYLNKVVRGLIYLAASFFASYIVVTVAEYYGNFSPLIRTFLFYSFLLLNGTILINWIILPLLSFYNLGKHISHEKASEIIGQHFSHIKDKLLNTLQLKKLADENHHQKSLIEASINQKIDDLKPIPFTSAIRINDNRKYLKFALPPLAIILFIGATAPSIFSESTERLLKHDKKFIKKAPFEFVILNKNLSSVQGDDFELKIKMNGNEIPQDIYLEDGANTFKLEKENIIRFNYTFRNIQNTKKIRLVAGEFSSDTYTIAVKRRPTLLNFDVMLDYPAYIGKKNETVSNSGDLIVPVGTQVNWRFKTGNTSTIQMTLGTRNFTINPSKENEFNFSYRALQNTGFTARPLNGEVSTSDLASYTIKVIPDLSPAIQLNERPDSVNTKMLYFVGQVSDDYGFSSLKFNYKILDGEKVSRSYSKVIPFDRNTLQSNFFHVWDIKEINAAPGQQIEYYFEIADNDGINGPKVTRSVVKTVKLPTQAESERNIEQSSKAVQQKMEQAIRQAGQIERDAKRLTQDLINKKNLSFEERKQVEKLLEKQKALDNLINEVKKENKQKQLEQQDLQNPSQEIIEKQKQIEDLFNNVLDEKTRELLKNIERLLEQNNKNQTQQELSKMQVDNKTLQKELDRILELYKQLEFDQKLENAIDKLKEQAQKQEKLSEQSEKKNADPEALKSQQSQLQKDFDNLQKDLKDIEQKNEELEEKNTFENTEKEQQQIEEQQQESSDNLEKNNTKKAAENQKNASEQMQQLAKKMEQMQQENEMQEMQINMQNLREVLSNLLTSSFDQEKVMQSLKTTSLNDPNYVKLTQKQKDIKDNLKMVQDSLYSLSRQVPQIESVINKEIQTINTNIDFALQQLSERRTAEANRNQQYAMTSINNLALMLSEVEEQMQQAIKNAKQGKGKGKGKNPSLSELSKMQEKLNQNMQKAREQMQKQGQQQGQKPGEGKDGQQGQGKGQMSEQMARMAREQQLIRQALQEINREMNKDGKGGIGNLDKVTKEMEQTETDLVNKKIQQETLTRQQEILTKLLDADKAERERELDTQRESKQGKDQAPNYKIVLEEFNKIKQRELELLKTVPPSLNSFYKLKVGDYFRLLNTK